MEVPILRSASVLRKAKRLQQRWSRLFFAEVLSRMTIDESLTLKLNEQKRTYRIEFHFDEKFGKKHRNDIVR